MRVLNLLLLSFPCDFSFNEEGLLYSKKKKKVHIIKKKKKKKNSTQGLPNRAVVL
jgi:hypothetical protein